MKYSTSTTSHFYRLKPVKYLLCLLIASALLSACGGSIGPTDEQAPDPVVVDVPIAYIIRDLSNTEGSGVRPLDDPSEFIPGARLVIKDRASASAAETDITSQIFAQFTDDDGQPIAYDVKDLDSNYTGDKLIFAMRAPENDDSDVEPTWNIWEYDLVTETLTRIIQSDLVAESGQDTGPTYLPDGRIVFSSTRQRTNQFRLLDEGKPQYAGLEEGRDFPASVLHVMNDDGTNIKQISFNQSHDFDPVVLPNGKILFSRWDQAGGNKGIHLYQMNSDGSNLEIVYGRHSHRSIPDLGDIQFAATSITPNSKVLAAISQFDQASLGTDYVTIDIDNYIDNNSPIASMPSLTDSAQQPALFDNIDLINNVSASGYIVALYPLWDGTDRVIFSWDQCRLFAPLPEGSSPDSERTIAPCTAENVNDESYTSAPSLYGLWMYSFDDTEQQATQLPLNVASETSVVTEIVALESRIVPDNPSSTIDVNTTATIANQTTSLIEAQYGVLNIKSVYDLDGVDTSPNGIVNMANPLAVAPSERPARFLRVVKSVSIPDEDTLDFDNSLFGVSRGQLFREIMGYTPIQPDGSVKVAVPANVPFAISVVDANGKRISQRHNNWLQLVPAEQLNCIGCHEGNSTAPHGRLDAQPSSVNQGAISSGLPFPNTNPELFADVGDTMAETLARRLTLPVLTANIEYTDVWTDETLQAKTPSFSYRYQDLNTPLPISTACAQNYNALCRSVINYVDHIQPLFELERLVFDDDMAEIANNTCVACHSATDENGITQLPAGQLELTNQPSLRDADVITSYQELLRNDQEQELVDGILIDRLVPVLDSDGNPTFLLDEEGELVLDAEDNPIPITTTINVPASMRSAGARNSGRFFNKFEAEGTHAQMLSPAELRLISEWLDIGAQYYNNPFDAQEE